MIGQEFITGTEYSTCAIAHDGHLALFTDNVASISCFNYEHAGDPRLRKWVAKQYKLKKMVQNGDKLRTLNADEREQILGFPKGRGAYMMSTPRLRGLHCHATRLLHWN